MQISRNWISVSTAHSNVIRIFDINGHVQYQSKAERKTRYSTANLSKGMYIVNLKTGNKIYSNLQQNQ